MLRTASFLPNPTRRSSFFTFIYFFGEPRGDAAKEPRGDAAAAKECLERVDCAD